jgi:fluoride exporter
MREVMVVFLGGGLGAALRYGLSGSVYRLIPPTLPYGTLLVNVLGCLGIGFLMTFFEERFVVQPLLRVFLTIGVLGGFTTFSTFTFETIALLREGSVVSGVMNMTFSLVGCLLATVLGSTLGKLL